MQTIDFYFDPCCPFCWITSRWLLQVSAHREIDMSWRQFSLALKNNELAVRENESKYASTHRAGHRVQRVIAAAAQHHPEKMLELYTSFGVKFHIAGLPFDDTMIATVLNELQLPTELASAADDTSYDASLKDSLQAALKVVGNDVGVPLIIFTLADGTQQGYFGPVLNELPALEESLQIWDGLAALATAKSFYELKRTRPTGQPDVFTTARC
ncbi:MAG: DsbA family protein [Candidatus Saccharimonadales bacterium]